ncbi:hypothetical protein K493DRAFT_347652 [Basidiobolus meristosporus CBS 931.73]|uniref:Uncharacterized protein n=1 Tax=Basidiobolus meristosporus CBS 931.73 TaxID=1314790 RepID=A0A1Y1YS49_9FUNG|nr:hypothetical protein K493DRAFT_347652 [Basidiobolus meristosporus CBS 931.73]|eukprot:ORY00851.1 hypothetical protein K493DRAFT_347652 [Basidiobolus meristosporus CBS 931.73]
MGEHMPPKRRKLSLADKESQGERKADSRSSTPVSRDNSFQKHKSHQSGKSGNSFSGDSRKKGKKQRALVEVDFVSKPESYKKVKSSRDLSPQNGLNTAGNESNPSTSMDVKISAWHALGPIEGGRNGSLGSGQLHRKGKNYKPVSERRATAQKENRNASRKKNTPTRPTSMNPLAPEFVWRDEPNRASGKQTVVPNEHSFSNKLEKRIAEETKGLAEVDCPEFKPSLNFNFSKLNLNPKKDISAALKSDTSSNEKEDGKRSRSDTDSSLHDLPHASGATSASITTHSSTVTTPNLTGSNISSRWNLNAPTFVPRSTFSFTPATPPTMEIKIPASTATTFSNDKSLNYQSQETFHYPLNSNYPYDTGLNGQYYEPSEFTYKGLNGLEYPSNEMSQEIEFIYDRGFGDEAVYPTPEEEYGYPTSKNGFDYNPQHKQSHQSATGVASQHNDNGIKPSSQTNGLLVHNKNEAQQLPPLLIGIELKDGSVRTIEIHPNDDLENKARQFCAVWEIPGKKIVQRLAIRLAQERKIHALTSPQ